MRISRFAWLLGLVAFTAGGCKASKEDVMKAWGASEAAVGSYSTKYPAFAKVIKSTHVTQKKAFDAASKGKGDVPKMEAAHKGLKAVTGPISTYESNLARIAKLRNHRYVLKNPASKVNAARAKADKKIAEAAAVIANAKDVKSAADVQKHFGEANKFLGEALGPLERLKKKGAPKRKKRKKRKKRR